MHYLIDVAASVSETSVTECLNRGDETNLKHMLIDPMIKKPLCLCLCQARSVSTGELAAIKVIKLEPGRNQPSNMLQQHHCISSYCLHQSVYWIIYNPFTASFYINFTGSFYIHVTAQFHGHITASFETRFTASFQDYFTALFPSVNIHHCIISNLYTLCISSHGQHLTLRDHSLLNQLTS